MEYGKRKCKVCSEVFNKKMPLDMFCSYACKLNYNKKIKPFSAKRKARNSKYLKERINFLSNEQNKFCPVMGKIFNSTVKTSEIHHVNGRENQLLINQKYWLAVSREGHQWIHMNPKLSREQGWLI